MRTALLVLAALVLAGCASPSTTTTTSTPGATTTTPSVPPGDHDANGGGLACAADGLVPDAAWKGASPHVMIQTSKGDITVELAMERAPVTASHFLDLTRSGYYDGKSFYRVARDFVIQGGGRAAAPQTIPDEFNPTLRHDAAGVLSMATAGPDTGSSEFFITLVPTPSLDDRHAVFGHVIDGMDVVHAIGALAPASGDGAPTETVTITKAKEVDAGTFEPNRGVGIHPVLSQKQGEPGRGVTFAVVLQNVGGTRDAIGLRATLPAGWTCSVDTTPVVPAGTGRVVFVTLTAPAGATGTTDVPLEAVSSFAGTSTAHAVVHVTMTTLGADVKDGDRVTANYAGVLPDGRLFDTSFASVGNDPGQPKFNTSGGWSPHSSYAPFPFTVGSGVIAGFTKLAKTAKVGETVTSRIPQADAYSWTQGKANQPSMYSKPLTGRDLVFELEIQKVG